MKKKLLWGFLILLIAIQAVRPEKNVQENAAAKDITQFVEVPDNVMNILKTSCYDCHSNKTNYRWYHEIMPVGWWLNHHVEEGKEHLNFSEFSAYNLKKMDHKLEEVAEEVAEHEMPMSSYTFLHKDAELTPEQIRILSDWVTQERKKLQSRF